MACCRLVFSFLVLSVVQSYADVGVPVFLWGDLAKPGQKTSPLSLMKGEEFGDVLKQELQKDPFTVIFIEETLSVEDLSRKDFEGYTSYPYLHSNIGNALYLAAVEEPVGQLNSLTDPKKVDHVKLTENGLSAEIEPDSGKFLFINLKDAKEGESRSDLLRRHNDFMEKMFTKLRERYDSVVAVYTAHYPSWTVPDTHSRVRRQAARAQNLVLDGLLIYYENILFEDGTTTLTFTQTTGSELNLNGTEQNNTLIFQNANVTMNFVSKAGYWFLNSITYRQEGLEEEMDAVEEVYAILGFSYRCGQNVSFASFNDTKPYKVTFQDLKVQPFFVSNNTGLTYGDSYHCVGFFSVPIWSSLFVVFILLAITFYGIMMMMDIRAMDRFDDPKGKTININAGE